MTLAFLSALAVFGCGGAVPVTPQIVQAAQRRSPEATQASLEHGERVFEKSCATCHTLPNPKSKNAEEWPKILHKMARRAHLGAPDEKDVLDYILAVHDAAG